MNTYNQSGKGTLGVYLGAYQQKGYCIGGMFQKFFKWIVPVFQQHAYPLIQSGVKTVGKEALTSFSNIAKDVVAGKDVKEAAQEHLTSAIDNLKDKIENKLEGKGIKRKKI